MSSSLVGAGMCRAHGIAHQAVREAAALPQALQSAWRLNRHSVVEVCHAHPPPPPRFCWNSSQLVAVRSGPVFYSC